ncbi:hypothetical protein [Siphonobacter curvatus]|uniref:hypothetical protein n=1 Tax=Siphonobacter curvatus TaxID=2094562 RepID=UPI0010570104|nr:hypothetical protein [Siphonobacter curvatus]
MSSLTPQQTYCLRQHLHQVGTQEQLIDELVDHLACQMEEHMSHGLSFEKALDFIRLEATSLSVRHLQQTLVRQGAVIRTSFWQHPARFTKREKTAFGLIQPVRNALLIGVFLSTFLTGWLLASRGFTMPIGLGASLLCPLLLLLSFQGLSPTQAIHNPRLFQNPVRRKEYGHQSASRKRLFTNG